VKQSITALIAGGVLALAASPALAAQDYPTGLFENSPVVPSGPPDATVQSAPPDADVPFGPPLDAVDPLDDYCAGVPFRTFSSLAEVRRAHAQCDHAHSVAPLSPPEEDQPDVIGMTSTGPWANLEEAGLAALRVKGESLQRRHPAGDGGG